MHRDRKLGLGLGILLVGVVAAFFFRHQADPKPSAPALSDAESLDRQIDTGDVVPYPETPRDDAGPETTGQPADEAWDVPEFLTGGDANAASPTSPPPNPISLTPTDMPQASTGGAEAVPEHNRAWQAPDEAGGSRGPVGRATTPATGVAAAGPAADGLVRHRVVPGDTLSGLATRYLGSSARFLEIYEANRDVLRSPNDLRVGMTLRIPPRREPPPPRIEDGRTVGQVSQPARTGLLQSRGQVGKPAPRPFRTATDTDPADGCSSADNLLAFPAVDRSEFERDTSPVGPRADSESRLRFEPVGRSPLARHARSAPVGGPTAAEPDGGKPPFGAPTVDLLPPEEMFADDRPQE